MTDTEKAASICEQMAVNLRANAVNCESRILRDELEMCAETADQCALSIRHGRPITSGDKSIQKRIV